MPTIERKHGVTPGLSHLYGTRTVESRIPFVLQHLRPGMDLLDVGCGPGSITLGLAEAVAPGRVVGVDYDVHHIEAARRLAAEHGVTNVTFDVGDIYALPYDDASFDAAVESSVFIHLGRHVEAAREVYRMLKPGGVLLTSDTCMDGTVTGPPMGAIREAYRFFHRWHRSRGCDLTIGKRMPSILRRAGFDHIEIGASSDWKAGPQAVAEHARLLGGLFEPGGGIRATALERGWTDEARMDRIAAGWRAWAADPDAFVVFVMVELVARKTLNP